MTGIYEVFRNGKQIKSRGKHPQMEWLDVCVILNNEPMNTGDTIEIKCLLED